MSSTAWMSEVRSGVEARLRAFFDDKRAEAFALHPRTVELVDSIDALTMRGGKRLRSLVITAGFHACGSGGDAAGVVDLGAAIEVLQSFLLIHDDWMDQDDERRGGPSVFAELRDRHGDAHLGASLAVLAGDLAAVYAAELFESASFPSSHRSEARSDFLAMQREVFFGQQLDLLAVPEVERMYDLKTGSYTVRGPVRLGASLAAATPEQRACLERFAAPLGVAFQLRDELLDAFGDPAQTGKPQGSDLRAGKLTVLVVEARSRGSDEDRAALAQAFGRASADDRAMAAAIGALERSGARARVEERLGELLGQAREALSGAPLDHERLDQLVDLLGLRDR